MHNVTLVNGIHPNSLTWDKPMTSAQAMRYWTTYGLIPAELYEADLRRQRHIIAELQAAIAGSAWTPVTESLPPENVRVQVWFGDHEHADHAMLFDGNWINGNWHHYLPLNESGITHWRHITPPTTAKENR